MSVPFAPPPGGFAAAAQMAAMASMASSAIMDRVPRPSPPRSPWPATRANVFAWEHMILNRMPAYRKGRRA